MSPLHFLHFLSVLPRTDTPRLLSQLLKTINPLGIPEIQNIFLSFVSVTLPFATHLLCVDSTFYHSPLPHLYRSVDFKNPGRLLRSARVSTKHSSRVRRRYDGFGVLRSGTSTTGLQRYVVRSSFSVESAGWRVSMRPFRGEG